MNRLQFWILVSLASLVFICLAVQASCAIWSQRLQNRVIIAQQKVQQGRVCEQRWRQLIQRVAEVNQKAQDQGLRDILSRQGVTVKVTPSPETSTVPAPSAAPAPVPANP